MGGNESGPAAAAAVERALLLAFCARSSGDTTLAALAESLNQSPGWSEVGSSAQLLLGGAYEDALRLCCPWVYELTFDSAGRLATEDELSGPCFVELVEAKVDAMLREEEPAARSLNASRVLCAGVAGLLRFLQANLTGPELPIASLLTQEEYRAADEASGSDRAAEEEIKSTRLRAQLAEERKQKRRALDTEWKTEVLRWLAVDGNIVAARFSEPARLLISLLLLRRLDRCMQQQVGAECSYLATSAWWAARAEGAQQKILEGRCPTLKKGRLDKLQRVRAHFKQLLSENKSLLEIKDNQALACAVSIEVALAYADYGDSNSMSPYLKEAASSIGINMSLSGALGKRTVHQIDEKAQLVVVIENADGTPAKADDNGGDNLIELEEEAEGYVGDELEDSNNDVIAGARTSDIYKTPHLSEEDAKARVASAAQLSASEQFLILAQCLYTKREQAKDELTTWRMAPYVEAISSQSKSLFLAQQLCHLLLARKEKDRGRTVERSLVRILYLLYTELCSCEWILAKDDIHSQDQPPSLCSIKSTELRP